MKRVFWTREEEDQVFSQVPEPVIERWPTMWKRVQQVLPEDRRKSLITSSSFTELKHKYHDWRKRHKSFAPPAQGLLEKPPELGTAHLHMGEQSFPSGAEPHFIVIEKVVKVEPDYLNIPTSTLLRLLGERLALQEQFELRFRQLEDAIESRRLAERTHNPALGPLPPEKPREEKIRIVIVGPLDSQAAEIEARCANTPKPVRLRFYDKDSRNQEPAGIVDYAIVTRHCNHAWWDKMKAVLPNDRVFFVESGIQPVVQRIYDICAKRDA